MATCDQSDSVVSADLRRMDEKLDGVATAVSGLKVLMTSVETNLAALNRWIDHLDARVDRIEHRLCQVDPTWGHAMERASTLPISRA